MDNNETFEEQDVMEESPKGNRRPVLLFFGGILLVGVLLVAAFVGAQTLNKNKVQTQAASTTSSLDPAEAFLAFAQCMRDKGISNFPDPVDEGINLSGTGIDRNTPEFKSAEKACEALLPQPSS